MASELVKSKYYLNIRSGYMAPVTLHCSYGDSGQEITFYIFDGGDTVALDGASATIHGTRRDGANFGPFNCTVSGNSVSFILQSSMTAVEGGGIAEFVFSKSGLTVGTANFGILVENAVFPNGVSYDSDPSVYQDILRYAQGLAGNLTADYTAKIAQESASRVAGDANTSSQISSVSNQLSSLSSRVDSIVATAGDGNTEIVDARSGYDDTSYTSLGEAVRTQTLDVNSRINAFRNPPIDVVAFSAFVGTGTGTYTKISRWVYNVNLSTQNGSAYAGASANLGTFNKFTDALFINRGKKFIHVAVENIGTTVIRELALKMTDYPQNYVGQWGPTYYPVNEYVGVNIYPGEIKDLILDVGNYLRYVKSVDSTASIESTKCLGVAFEIPASFSGSGSYSYSFNVSFYDDDDDNLYYDTFNKSSFSINAGYKIPEKAYLYRSDKLLENNNIFINKSFDSNGDTKYVISATNVAHDANNQQVAIIGFDVSEYFGKNCSFVIDVTQTGVYSNLFLNNIYLSTRPHTWGSSFALVSLVSYIKNETQYSITIPLDEIGYNYGTMSTPVFLDFGFMVNPGSTISSIAFTLTPYVVYNSAKIIGANSGSGQSEETADTDIIFWGDSLTAGAGGSGTTYPSVCASELNCSHFNCGVGGETTNTIAARQGGNSIIIPAGPVNGTYSLDDLTDIFGFHVNPLRQGNGLGSGSAIVVNGKTCNLAITQTSSTSTDATYTISGYTGSNLAVPTVARFNGCTFTGKVTVIWVGTNGSTVDGVSDSVDARITIIDSMIAHLHNKRYVILGLSTGSESSRAAEDLKLLQKYGANFFPTRKLLVQNGLALVGITPTSQDNTDIASGVVPTSLRSDGTHLNASGYTALGKMLAQKIRSLGFDQYL